MKLAILGATGFVGKVLVRKALDAGHEITILARTPEKLGDLQNNVNAIHGSLADDHIFETVVDGADAVLSTAGPTNAPHQPDLFRVAMVHLVQSMDKHNIKRIITISHSALRIPDDRISFKRRMIISLANSSQKHMIKAKQKEFEVLSQSHLDWTTIRTPKITDDPATGRIRAGDWDLLGFKVNRYDLADFMLEQLHHDTWYQKAPFVATR